MILKKKLITTFSSKLAPKENGGMHNLKTLHFGFFNYGANQYFKSSHFVWLHGAPY